MKIRYLALVGLALAAGEAAATCPQTLQFFGDDTGVVTWQSGRVDSPKDIDSSRVAVHVLRQDGNDYAGAYTDCSGIENKLVGAVRNLSFEFLNDSTETAVHIGAGAPRYSVDITQMATEATTSRRSSRRSTVRQCFRRIRLGVERISPGVFCQAARSSWTTFDTRRRCEVGVETVRRCEPDAQSHVMEGAGLPRDGRRGNGIRGPSSVPQQDVRQGGNRKHGGQELRQRDQLLRRLTASRLRDAVIINETIVVRPHRSSSARPL